jgi:hypothetical protein
MLDDASGLAVVRRGGVRRSRAVSLAHFVGEAVGGRDEETAAAVVVQEEEEEEEEAVWVASWGSTITFLPNWFGCFHPPPPSSVLPLAPHKGEGRVQA